MNFKTDRASVDCPLLGEADISQVKSDAVPWLPAQTTSGHLGTVRSPTEVGPPPAHSHLD